MEAKVHRLKQLRLLSEGLSRVERQHHQRIARGDNAAEADRETAQAALNGVVMFLQNNQMESRPLIRLVSALAALTGGSSAPAMLAPTPTRHRRPDPPTIELIKGRLAAIMEYRQQTGATRKAAGEWVARNLPAKFKSRLGPTSRATIDSWLVKWGGKAPHREGSGREGYLAMRAILVDRKLTEQQLKNTIQVIVRYIPS